MLLEIIECQHCGTINAASRCGQCERGFVITTCHLTGDLRDETARAVADATVAAPDLCDFCSFQAAGRASTQQVLAGLRQRTCPSCRTEFLSGHGYSMWTDDPRIRELQEESERLYESIKRIREENSVLLEELRIFEMDPGRSNSEISSDN